LVEAATATGKSCSVAGNELVAAVCNAGLIRSAVPTFAGDGVWSDEGTRESDRLAALGCVADVRLVDFFGGSATARDGCVARREAPTLRGSNRFELVDSAPCDDFESGDGRAGEPGSGPSAVARAGLLAIATPRPMANVAAPTRNPK
jgi:hypothetical protein